MKKFFILVTVFFIASSVKAQFKNFEIGGQLRLRGVAEENYALDSAGAPNALNEYDFRQRSRLHAIYHKDDFVGFFEVENNSRWGFRANTPNTATDPSQLDESGELYINNVFVDFPVPLVSLLAPTYARIGRQYFQLGRGLVIDIDSDDAPDPLDGARVMTKFSRFFGMDLIYADKKANKQRRDQKMMGGYFSVYTDKGHFLPEQNIFPYTFYQRDKSHTDFQDNRMFSGVYMEGELPYFMNILNIDRIKYRMEYSHQYGSVDSLNNRSTKYNGHAFYGDINIRRDFKGGLQLKLKGMYFVSTGNKPNSTEIGLFRSDYQNFRPGELFGEEKIGSSAIQNIYADERFGRGGSNMQVLNGAIELEYRDISIEAEYFNYLANQVTTGVSNKLGHEVDLTLQYEYTKNLTSHLRVARFTPGPFFGSILQPANEIEMEIKLDF